MAYYAVDVTLSCFALIKADSPEEAIKKALEIETCANASGAEIVDSFDTKEDVSKIVPLGEFHLEIED